MSEARIRVMVVDDHPLMREAIAAVIGGQADLVLVGEASDGHEAVEAYLRLHHGCGLDEYPHEIVGVRPGEKNHEVLATREELSRARMLDAEDLIQDEPDQQQEL